MKNKKEEFAKEFLMRLLIILVCAIIFYFWNMAMLVILIIQLIVYLIKKEANLPLKEFSNIWYVNINAFIKYSLFLADKKPFPFAELKTK